MKTYEEWLAKEMQNPEFKREYELLKEEYAKEQEQTTTENFLQRHSEHTEVE